MRGSGPGDLPRPVSRRFKRANGSVIRITRRRHFAGCSNRARWRTRMVPRVPQTLKKTPRFLKRRGGHRSTGGCGAVGVATTSRGRSRGADTLRGRPRASCGSHTRSCPRASRRNRARRTALMRAKLVNQTKADARRWGSARRRFDASRVDSVAARDPHECCAIAVAKLGNRTGDGDVPSTFVGVFERARTWTGSR